MRTSSFLTLIKASAFYDLLVTAVFAVPWLSAMVIESYRELHQHFGVNGEFPSFLPLHLFFVNLMAAVVIVWSMLRLRHTQAIFGLYDSYARFMFSAIMLVYLIVFEVSGLLWCFFIPEFLWGCVQFYGYQQVLTQAATKQ